MKMIKRGERGIGIYIDPFTIRFGYYALTDIRLTANCPNLSMIFRLWFFMPMCRVEFDYHAPQFQAIPECCSYTL